MDAKKILIIALLSASLALSACGSGGGPSSEDGGGGKSDQSCAVKIDDIDCSLTTSVVNGERFVVMKYANDSDLVISDLEIDYTEKSGVSDDERDEVFSRFQEYQDLSNNDMKDLRERNDGKICFTAECMKCVGPGESSAPSPVCFLDTSMYTNDTGLTDLVKPDKAHIEYVDDGMIHSYYYDFSSEEYTESGDPKPSYQWKSTDLTKKAPAPDKKYIVEADIDEDMADISVKGADSKYFREYLDECRDMGYTEGDYGYVMDESFSLEDKDGYEVDCTYYPDEDLMEIFLSE